MPTELAQKQEIESPDLTELENFSNFLRYERTWIFNQFIRLRFNIIALFTGNQAMKTSACAYQYVLRILGTHPVPEKNVLYFECPNNHKFNKITLPKDSICPQCKSEIKIHERGSRVFRFASEVLPGEKSNVSEDGQSAEVKNTVYPEFKKWLPPFLIKRDITFRNMAMIIRDPNIGYVFCDQQYKGEDIIVELVAYSQTVASTAGKQRMSVWEDEEAPYDFHEEQLPRLMAENGDLLISLTPANKLCFDEQTEIITNRGWKKYDEILLSDKLLTCNISKNLLEWKSIIGFYLEKYHGKMIQLKSKTFDALVTPEHKWLVCNDRRQNDLYLEKTENLNTRHIIRRMVSETNYLANNKELCYGDEFIALIGWVVTDGSVSNNKVCIYQSLTAYPEYCKKIDKLTKPFPQCVRKDVIEYGNTVIEGKEWNGSGIMCRWNLTYDLRKSILNCLEFGKSIKEDLICSLSQRQLQILFDTMTDGDGSRRKDSGIVFTQSQNEPLIDNFLLIATLLGRLAKKGIIKGSHGGFRHIVWVYSQGKRFWPNSHFKQLNKEIVDYDGYIWCLTTENKTVVIRRNGCVSISGNSWSYDEIFERARVYIRTQAVCDYLTTQDYKPEQIEWTDNKTPIAVIQAASDDNPTLSIEAIEEKMSIYEDPDIVATRRYGVHKQVKGRIFKGFEYPAHFIEKNEYFPEGIPIDWTHARGIDYHPQTNWACGCISLSPQNEAFIWKEYNPSPERFTTAEICRDFAVMTAGYKFILNLIDPLSEEIKKDKITIRDDINREFWELKKEGISLNSYWQCWDTKGEKGRDEIRKRLKNAKEVGRPFNNKRMKDGREIYLPTIWILNTCVLSAKSIKMWRWEEYTDTKMAMVKGDKNKPQQKWSHFNTVWEALFKHPAFKPRRNIPREERGAGYFQGRR